MNTLLSCTLIAVYSTVNAQVLWKLATEFQDSKGGSGSSGNMFDVKNKGNWALTIEKFDITSMWGNPTVVIYTKTGTYSGYEYDINAWTKIHQETIAGKPPGAATPVSTLETTVPIQVGAYQAFYIYTDDVIWTTESTNPVGTEFVSDDNLAIYEGITIMNVFQGEIVGPEVWNGRIYYDLHTPAPTTAQPTKSTANPTMSPTKNPTINPSINPTTTPTKNPTKNPTVNPSRNPTKPPTKNPTSNPTTLPTVEPTAIPTLYPTMEPTMEPIAVLIINQPTEYTDGEAEESTSTTDTTETLKAEDAYSAGKDEKDIVYVQLFTLAFGGFLVLVLIASFIYAKIYKNDFYDKLSFIMFIVQVLDMLYDIMFCLALKNAKLYTLMISSAIFIIFPVIISYLQLLIEIKSKWMKKEKNELRQWLTTYNAVLYGLSIISGSAFNAIKLCKSNIFGLKIFDIPLTKAEVKEFQTKRVFSIILFENLPQLSMQCIYLFTSQSAESISNVVFISMGFSLVSIIIAITSSIQSRQIIKSQDHIEISFVVSNMDLNEREKARNCVNALKKGISGKLGVNSDLFEITKPTLLPNNALNVFCIIYINQKMAVNNNYEQLIDSAKANGEIAKFVQDSWNLSKEPIISNLSYKQIMSQNTIQIRATSVNISVNDGEKQTDEIAMSIINAEKIQLPDIPLIDGKLDVDNVTPGKFHGEFEDSDSESMKTNDKITPN